MLSFWPYVRDLHINFFVYYLQFSSQYFSLQVLITQFRTSHDCLIKFFDHEFSLTCSYAIFFIVVCLLQTSLKMLKNAQTLSYIHPVLIAHNEVPI